MIKNGWLYAFFIFLAQTCNPYYSATERYDNSGIVSEDIFIPDNAMELEDVITQEDISMRPSSPNMEQAPPPPPPPLSDFESIPEPPQEEMFMIVEEMPRFASPDCEAKNNRQEKKICAEKAMLKFLYKNINYPQEARKNGVQGKAIVKFVVERDGTISNVKAIRDPGAGLGDEAVRVIRLMKATKWIPGKQRGKSVRVQYTLPVKFSL